MGNILTGETYNPKDYLLSINIRCCPFCGQKLVVDEIDPDSLLNTVIDAINETASSAMIEENELILSWIQTLINLCHFSYFNDADRAQITHFLDQIIYHQISFESLLHMIKTFKQKAEKKFQIIAPIFKNKSSASNHVSPPN